VGFEGGIVFDASKPDGTPRKLMDVGRLNAMGWHAQTDMQVGLASAYRDFLESLQKPVSSQERPLSGQRV